VTVLCKYGNYFNIVTWILFSLLSLYYIKTLFLMQYINQYVIHMTSHGWLVAMVGACSMQQKSVCRVCWQIQLHWHVGNLSQTSPRQTSVVFVWIPETCHLFETSPTDKSEIRRELLSRGKIWKSFCNGI